MIGIIYFCLITLAWAVPPSSVIQNNSGVEDLKKEQSYEAYQKFVQSLSQSPFNPEMHMNLALAYERNKEPKKALEEYEVVQKLPNTTPDLKFKALFNSAKVKGESEDISGALMAYQKALEIKPDSLEVKTNIELLTKQAQGKKGRGGQNKKDQKQDDKSKDSKNADNDKKNQDNRTGDEPKKQKPEPKPFDSKELTREDVRKILDEIKNQESQIRAEYNRKQTKDNPRDKNW